MRTRSGPFLTCRSTATTTNVVISLPDARPVLVHRRLSSFLVSGALCHVRLSCVLSADAGRPVSAVAGGALAVLRTPRVVWVLAASLAGRIPLGSAPLALLLFARETMTIAMAGVLAGAYSAGMAVGQPMLSRMVDRWRQPPVVWAGAAVSTAGFLAIVAGPGPGVAVGAAFAAGLGAPPFESCLRVLWTDLVGERLRHAAYTVDVTLQELIFIVGPLVTVGAVALAGPPGGLVAAAAVQLAGAGVFTSAPVVRRWRGERAERHWLGPLRSGPLRLYLAATLLVGAGVGSTTVAVVAYAEAEGARSWSGWLLAAQATGALVGGLAYARLPHRDPQRALPVVIAVLAAGYVPLLLTPGVGAMSVALAVSGLGLPAVLTGVFLTADGVAPAGTAAEAFAWVATAFAVGSAAGAAAGGALLDAYPGAAGFGIAPLAILGAAVLAATRTRRSS